MKKNKNFKIYALSGILLTLIFLLNFIIQQPLKTDSKASFIAISDICKQQCQNQKGELFSECNSKCMLSESRVFKISPIPTPVILSPCRQQCQNMKTGFMKEVCNVRCTQIEKQTIKISPKPTKSLPKPTSLPVNHDLIKLLPTVINKIPTPTRTLVPTTTAQSKNGPYFEFGQTNFTAKIGQEFKIDVLINTFQGVDISSADMLVKYESSTLSLVNMTNLQEIFSSKSMANKDSQIYVAGFNKTRSESINANNRKIFVTLVFKPIKVGQTGLSFICAQGATTDSNIIKVDAYSSDIIDCSKNNESSISIQ
jgi:hypothetical protein